MNFPQHISLKSAQLFQIKLSSGFYWLASYKLHGSDCFIIDDKPDVIVKDAADNRVNQDENDSVTLTCEAQGELYNGFSTYPSCVFK